MSTYISTNEHLLGEILHVSLVGLGAAVLSSGEDVLQIRLEEPAISAVGHEGVRVGGNLVLDVQAFLSVPVEEVSAEVGRIGHVADLSKINFGQGEAILAPVQEEVLEPGEGNVGETFRCCHCTQCLAVCPGITIWYTQEI